MFNYNKGISFPFRFAPAGHTSVSDCEPDNDYRHIRESIQQILLTEPGERLMEQDFGCPLKDLLFEPIDETLSNIIVFRVTNSLNAWENRISVDNIRVTKGGKDGIHIIISFTILDTQISDTITVIRQA